MSTVNLQTNPDLTHIATHARNVEYNPKVRFYACIRASLLQPSSHMSLWRLQRFSAAILRLREPKATALVFKSGKMVITGARNEDDAQLAARRIAKVIQVCAECALWVRGC